MRGSNYTLAVLVRKAGWSIHHLSSFGCGNWAGVWLTVEHQSHIDCAAPGTIAAGVYGRVVNGRNANKRIGCDVRRGFTKPPAIGGPRGSKPLLLFAPCTLLRRSAQGGIPRLNPYDAI